MSCFQYIASCCSREMEDKGGFQTLKELSVSWKFAWSEKFKWVVPVNSKIEDLSQTKGPYVISPVYAFVLNFSSLCRTSPASSVTSPEYLPRDRTKYEWRKTSVTFPCFTCYLLFSQPLFLTGQYSLLRKPENQACSPLEIFWPKAQRCFFHKVLKAKPFLTLHMFFKNVLSHSNTFYLYNAKCVFSYLSPAAKQNISNPVSFIKWLLFSYCNDSAFLLPHT